jgi:hypothetical protein
VEALRSIGHDPVLLDALRDRCRDVYRAYLSDELVAIRQLVARIAAHVTPTTT